MKTLFFKIVLFVGGILLYILTLAYINMNAFTFRAWESLSWTTGIRPTIGIFYPNKNVIRNEGGDLGHGSKYEVIKNNIIWKTDKYGFRNDSSKATEYKIVLVGDSFSAGGATSQEFILSTQIGKRVKTQVYNYSPMNIDGHFINNLKSMNIEPKIVIYQVIERDIPKIDSNELNRNYGIKYLFKDNINKILRNYSLLCIDIAIDDFYKRGLIRYLESKIDSISGKFRLPVIIGSDNVLFYEGSLIINTATMDDNNIRKIAIELKNINDYFLALGIDFIFLPVPNKESVYYELLPEDTRKNFNNKNFLTKLHKEFCSLGVRSIDTYSIFRSRFLAGERLYYSDDTHWNKTGIDLASELISMELHRDLVCSSSTWQ